MMHPMDRIKRKYVPDLTGYMAQCEMNYVLMMRLFRLSENQSQSISKGQRSLANLGVIDDEKVALPFLINVDEQAKYTTTLNLTVELVKSEWVSPIKLRVRLYHDAQMAEVLERNRNHAPKSANPYPRQIKHYPDDKFQRNELLHQCLKRCFESSADKIAVPVITYSED